MGAPDLAEGGFLSGTTGHLHDRPDKAPINWKMAESRAGADIASASV
jgi:hypothetical protein